MTVNRSVRKLAILCAALAALAGCAEPRVRPQGAPAGAARNVEETATPELKQQVASLQRFVAQMEGTYAAQEAEIRALQRYAAQMDETYAAQEAEILALRREIAGPATCAPPLSPEARFGSNAATALAARQSLAF